LIKYRPPKESSHEGVTVRNDTGVFEGGEISIYYDPMIAKLCTHAPDRATAIAAMSSALDEFYVDGIQHNIPFLAAIMENERWKSGQLSTGFIAEEFPGGFAGNELTPELKARLSAVAVMADHVENRRKRRIGGQMNGKTVKYDQNRVVRLGLDDWLPVSIVNENKQVMTLDTGKECFVKSAWAPGHEVWRGEIDGRPVAVLLRKILNGYRLSHRGVSIDAHVFSRREAELARLMPAKRIADTSKKLLCPMPGLVVSIAVAEGQEIKAGEPLAIVEAMKMENILRAERDGVVKKVHVKKGDSLAVDAVIMEFA
ncbi:MAG TPA: biotin/lipoyl-containing protein, partial [Nordella sp.]|nr:biotin/lipoyl-containing protein [Nordella sp.]